MMVSDVLAPDEPPRVAGELARLRGGDAAKSVWRFRRKFDSTSLFILTVDGFFTLARICYATSADLRRSAPSCSLSLSLPRPPWRCSTGNPGTSQ